jgi:hypothetical protein
VSAYLFNFQSFRSEIDTNFDSLTQPIGIDLTRFTRKKVEKLLPDENSVGGVAPIRLNLADFGAVFDFHSSSGFKYFEFASDEKFEFQIAKTAFWPFRFDMHNISAFNFLPIGMRLFFVFVFFPHDRQSSLHTLSNYWFPKISSQSRKCVFINYRKSDEFSARSV